MPLQAYRFLLLSDTLVHLAQYHLQRLIAALQTTWRSQKLNLRSSACKACALSPSYSPVSFQRERRVWFISIPDSHIYMSITVYISLFCNFLARCIHCVYFIPPLKSEPRVKAHLCYALCCDHMMRIQSCGTFILSPHFCSVAHMTSVQFFSQI